MAWVVYIFIKNQTVPCTLSPGHLLCGLPTTVNLHGQCSLTADLFMRRAPSPLPALVLGPPSKALWQ